MKISLKELLVWEAPNSTRMLMAVLDQTDIKVNLKPDFFETLPLDTLLLFWQMKAELRPQLAQIILEKAAKKASASTRFSNGMASGFSKLNATVTAQLLGVLPISIIEKDINRIFSVCFFAQATWTRIINRDDATEKLAIHVFQNTEASKDLKKTIIRKFPAIAKTALTSKDEKLRNYSKGIVAGKKVPREVNYRNRMMRFLRSFIEEKYPGIKRIEKEFCRYDFANPYQIHFNKDDFLISTFSFALHYTPLNNFFRLTGISINCYKKGDQLIIEFQPQTTIANKDQYNQTFSNSIYPKDESIFITSLKIDIRLYNYCTRISFKKQYLEEAKKWIEVNFEKLFLLAK